MCSSTSDLGCFEVIHTTKMKPSVVHRGYQYRKYRVNKNDIITWLCVREKSSKCHGRIKTRGNEVILVTGHVCNIDEMTYKRLKSCNMYKTYSAKKRNKKRTVVAGAAVCDKDTIPSSVPNGFLVDRSGFPSVNVISKTNELNVESAAEVDVTNISDNNFQQDCDGEYLSGKDVDTAKLNRHATKNNNVAFTPLPEIVEYKLQQPTVLEKIELTQSILDKSKTAKGPAGAPANTATNRYPGSGRPLEKRLHQEVTENEHDDDRMFMLSLTGKMKHLSPADNMKFRLEVQQLLLNKLCPDVTDNAPSSSSSFTSVLIKEEIQEEPLTDENLASISELKPPPVKIKKEVVDENSSTDMDFN